jgi:multidrug efflux system membrane fusion protein
MLQRFSSLFRGIRQAMSQGEWRWMLPWTLAVMGVAVTIAWILQPAPAPQQQSRGQGRGGPGGGGPRPGGPQGGAAPQQVSEGQTARRQNNAVIPQGTAVGTAIAAVSDLDVTLNALGTVTAAAMVTITPQISGQLQDVAFQEGQLVHKGDLIAQIDPRTFELQLKSGEANLARDKILRDNAGRDLERYRELQKENAASQQQVEMAAAALAQATASVSADEVAISSARLNLAYARIVAPITGRIGLRQVDPGNYITPSSSIAVLTQIDPINVNFTVPEDNLAAITERLRSGDTLQVTIFDRSNTKQLAVGQLASMDNLIDVTTGTVRIKSIFDNKDGKLFPNQFVNVRLQVDTVRGVTVLPPSAIQNGAPGTFVLLIKEDNTVTIRPVKTAISNATMTQIVSGINPGDQVVIDGIDRVREGTQVYVPNPPLDPTAAMRAASGEPTATPASDTAPETPRQRRRGPRSQDPAATPPATPPGLPSVTPPNN